ncbi:MULTISPECIES: DUF3299 domain-containing protein [unclassified Janthinobacterium]|uniref:DUF3299 domain-containing protein n=1 Tax=unclassified Janthinobacterium TaxID=2610881 RepID=UPI00088E8BE3|nr:MULTISPECIES: DUF3299 domain-containing protein [unclassified Janthinobacterium]SDA56869.1 hypothetical protein SAMN03159349_02040 [Janthinobacterium sp. 551a]SFB26971.1 hypothetical protein SAMN03159300_10345 [Janthinobacterium sp. 344]
MSKMSKIMLLGACALLATGVQAAPASEPPSFFAPLTEIPGVVSWKLLGQATTVKAKKGRMVPHYTPAISALDNTEVKVQGFMMPLEPGQKQKHFLLTVTSASCPFCLPAGPEGVVEIRSRTPVKFSYAPFIVQGRLKVLASDPMGLYYRMTDAAVVPQ